MPTAPAAAVTAFPDGLLHTVLDMLPMAFQLLRPLHAPDGHQVIDFHLEYLNPAGQQLLGLPEREARSMLERFPYTESSGIFDFYRRVFETGEEGHYETNYQADSLDSYFRFVARRSGPLLAVTFTAHVNRERTSAEEDLRRSHARERATRAEAEAQRARLEQLLMAAPAAICILVGPEQVFELANPVYQQLVANRPLLGRPLREALPEIVGQAVDGLLRQVYAMGTTHKEPGLLVPVAGTGGALENRYFNFVFQARRDEINRVDGVLVCAFEVTAQVQAQQRADALPAQVLASAQRLAQERENFHQIFKHAPAAICIQHGPEHRYDYFNPAYQQFSPDRELQGRPVAEALPETVPAGFVALLDEVYRTGNTYFGHELPLTLQQPDGSTREIYLA